MSLTQSSIKYYYFTLKFADKDYSWFTFNSHNYNYKLDTCTADRDTDGLTLTVLNSRLSCCPNSFISL